MKPVLLILAVYVVGLSNIAAAQVENDERDRSDDRLLVFTEVDRDRNDLLDREEVEAADPDADFDQMDEDDDGKVNRNEYFQYHRR